jgi:general secretion pathway protein B
MSFVLEALRKSEQERQQATAPGLGVLFPATVEERSVSTVRPALIAASLAVAMAAALWFTLRTQGSISPASPKVVAAGTLPEPQKSAEPAVSAPISAPLDGRGNSGTAPSPSIPAKVSAAAVETTSVKSKSRERVVPSGSSNNSSVIASTRSTDKTAPSTPANSSPEAIRPAVTAPESANGEPARDSSTTLPKDVPPMTIAGYIHDDQEGSMAMINDKLVREGEEVAPGLRLEKILADGAIFVYKGHRFRR